MHDPFITALNTQKSAMGWFNALSENLSNVYTPGYREKKVIFADFVNGVDMSNVPRKAKQGKAIPGRGPTNLFIEGKGHFIVRAKDGSLRYTRLGDFKFNGEGSLVNGKGLKVQGYLLGENGKALDTGGAGDSGVAGACPTTCTHQLDANGNPTGAGGVAGNNPSASKGGSSQIPTTEINLWVDPTNGKFYGKYDEYKIRTDGTVVGLANNGKTVTPLYKIALANFTNPGAMKEMEPQMYVPSGGSGEAIAGTGEIRSGLLEKSNVSLKEQVNFLREAKLQLDVASKLVSTNKNLLQESLRLLQ